MIKRLCFIIGLVILISSCQQNGKQELTDIQRQEIADTIRKRTQEWLDTFREFNRGSLDTFMDFWVESDEVSWLDNPALWTSNLTIIPTKERIKEFWLPQLDERSAHDVELVEDYVAVLSEDKAIHVFKANYRITDIEGKKGKEQTFCATNVYVRENDAWKILHHHQSYE